MTASAHHETRLPGVLVPAALIAAPQCFGGRAQGDCLTGDLILRGGHAVRLAASGSAARRLVLPRLAEPHVHLDKCHTIDRLAGVGGDLSAALAAQARDREGWTAADLRDRARRGLTELLAAGCGVARSHVDWGACRRPDAVPPAWDVLGELAQEAAPGIRLQRAALIGIDRMADAGWAKACARRIARDNGVLGGFVLGQDQRRQGILNSFRVAESFGLALDFHVDEGLEPGLDGLELIAELALETGFQGPVLCGHGCALMNRGRDETARIAEKLARAQVSVAVLPATNLYLQGRGTGTPDRRGLTRIHELQAAGVNVVAGSDNVRDAFCPLGRHDPRHSLSLAVLAAHLDPPLGRHLPMITTGACTALGVAPISVDGAAIADLRIYAAASVSALLSDAPAARPLAQALQGES